MELSDAVIKDKVSRELEAYFGQDTRRINHAKNVASFAEEILKSEKADRHIVIPVSLLHDIGIKLAEERHGSSAARYQEEEGPPVARDILVKLGFPEKDIDEICEIIAHHHTPGTITTMNFNILSDADWLENLKEELPRRNKTQLRQLIGQVFMTAGGRALAEKLYL